MLDIATIEYGRQRMAEIGAERYRFKPEILPLMPRQSKTIDSHNEYWYLYDGVGQGYASLNGLFQVSDAIGYLRSFALANAAYRTDNGVFAPDLPSLEPYFTPTPPTTGYAQEYDLVSPDEAAAYLTSVDGTLPPLTLVSLPTASTIGQASASRAGRLEYAVSGTTVFFSGGAEADPDFNSGTYTASVLIEADNQTAVLSDSAPVLPDIEFTGSITLTNRANFGIVLWFIRFIPL